MFYIYVWFNNVLSEDFSNFVLGNYVVIISDVVGCFIIVSIYISDLVNCINIYSNWFYFFGFEMNGFGIF